MEAKLKKLIKENETTIKKTKDKHDKSIEKSGEAINKLSVKLSTISVDSKALKTAVAKLKVDLKAIPQG